MRERFFKISYRHRKWVETEDDIYDSYVTRFLKAPTLAAALRRVGGKDEEKVIEEALTRWVIGGRKLPFAVRDKFCGAEGGWIEDVEVSEVAEGGEEERWETTEEDDNDFSIDFYSYLGISEEEEPRKSGGKKRRLSGT